MKALMVPNAAEVVRDSIAIVDDFLQIDTGIWTNEGTVAAATANRGGVLDIDTAATDNATAGLKSVNVFDFRDDKPLNLKLHATFEEAGSNAVNPFAGISNLASVDAQLGDDGAGNAADFHGAGFFAVDGSGTLGVISSVGTTQTVDLMTAGNRNNLTGALIDVSSAAERTFEIDVRGDGDGRLSVCFLINGELIARHTVIPAGSPTLMGVLFGLKAGAAAEETMLADWVSCVQAR